MSDFDFPELPSDEELGITDEDRKKYEEEFGDEGPETTDPELAALLGDTPSRPADSAKGGKGSDAAASSDSDARKKASKQVRKAEKTSRKAEKAARAEARRAEKERKKQERAERKRRKKEAKAAGGSGAAGDGEGTAPEGAPTEGAQPTAAAGAGSRSRWRGPVTLVVLLAAAAFGSSRTGLPSPAPANAPDSSFSSSRAMTTLVEMIRRAHPPGSPEHAWVRDFIIAELTELGFEPEVQTTTSLVEQGSFARAATVRNIIARRPGSSPTGGVLITAHYDSRELSPGAGDDGSGVVTALEAIRALQTGAPLQNDLIVVFTDAEELGLLGARAFVDEHPLMADVDIVLSFEMRGSAGPSIMFETADQNGWIVRTMREWDDHPYANSMSFEVYQRMPNGTDFTPFIEAGAQGLNFASIDNAHVYHQVFDTPDNLSEATLQHHGEHALGALRYYGNADLSSVNDDNVVYFTVPGLGLVVYPQFWVLPVSGVLIALLALATVVARRTGATPRGMALGVGLSLLAGAAAGGMGYGLMQWLPGIHGEDGMLHGSVFHHEGWYVLAVAFGALAVTTLLLGVLRRWASVVELSLGALVVPAGLAVAVSVAAPLAAMNLQWPTIAAAVAVLILSVLRDRAEGTVGWLSTLLLAVPVILLLEPIVELIWLALTLRLATVVAVLMAIMLMLCLPALDALRHPNAWWSPLLATALAATFLGVGVLGTRPNAERPAPSTLSYAYEHGSGDAVWVGGPGDADDPGVLWASAAAQASFEDTRDMSGFSLGSDPLPVATAPVFDAAPPEVYVVHDTVVSGARVVHLAARSRIQAEAMVFRLADGVVLESINGVSLENDGPVRVADHWGEPEGFVRLRLRMPSGAPIGLHIIEQHLRPDEIVGEGRFDRPGRLAPNINRLSDRAWLRYSVAALADPLHAIVTPEPPPEGLLDGSATVPAETPAQPLDTTLLAPAGEDTTALDSLDAGEAPVDTADTTTTDTTSTDTTTGDTTTVDTIGADTTAVEPTTGPTPVDTTTARTPVSSHRHPTGG